MLTRHRSFSILYGIQRIFLNVFYLVSVTTVFWLIFYLLHDVLQASGSLIIPVSIAYLVIIVLVYSIIHVVSYIPANLAGAFDPLKNGIADGSIDSGTSFSGKLADFMCTFFNFAFFDVQASTVHLKGEIPVNSSNMDLNSPGFDTAELEDFARSLNETGYYGKISFDPGSAQGPGSVDSSGPGSGSASGSGPITVTGTSISPAPGAIRGYLYVIPIIFGDKRLGYMAVVTRQKLWKIFIRLLDEFENDFVDDQVVHVLARKAESIS